MSAPRPISRSRRETAEGKRSAESFTRWDVFEIIAAWLQPAIPAAPPAVPPPDFPWEMAVEAASSHMVSPALGWSLLGAGAVTGSVADYFETILALSRARNAMLRRELETIVGAFNAAGIRPVLLKGAGFLASDEYPDPGIRMLADLDLLVPEHQLEAASAALTTTGFGPPRTGHRTPAGHHHLPARAKFDSGVMVELHREPIEQRFRLLVDSRRCLESGRPIEIGSAGALIPHPTDRIAHAIAHGQLADRNHRRGIPELRQMLDLAVLRARHEGEIDWPELRRRFGQAGFGEVLADTVTCAETLLGQPQPDGFGRRPAAVGRMRRALGRGPTRKAAEALYWTCRDAVTALRADPRRILSAIRRPKWWSPAKARHW